MSRSVWRIAADTAAYRSDDLLGDGAKVTGGRWNAVGHPVIYSSTTRALACLETVVHLNARGLPLNRYLVEITIPDQTWEAARRETATGLPVGWDAEPASGTSTAFGTGWLRQGRSALLVVPSVIVPEEFNVLINPAHADAHGIAGTKIRRKLYDPRLVGPR